MADRRSAQARGHGGGDAGRSGRWSALPWASWRKLLVAVGAVLVFGSYNLSIFVNERLLDRGTTVRLPLAPRDPRSLMTGDYMDLRPAWQGDVRIASVRRGADARAPSPAADGRTADAATADDGDAGTDGTDGTGRAPIVIADEDGYLIVTLDERRVARPVRAQSRPKPVADGEVALRYRVRGARLHVGPEAWFFEEGSGARYEAARFGEYRVDASGKMLLVRLLDQRLEAL